MKLSGDINELIYSISSSVLYLETIHLYNLALSEMCSFLILKNPYACNREIKYLELL